MLNTLKSCKEAHITRNVCLALDAWNNVSSLKLSYCIEFFDISFGSILGTDLSYHKALIQSTACRLHLCLPFRSEPGNRVYD